MSATKEKEETKKTEKRGIFYTPKSSEEMQEYLKKMSEAIPEESRIYYWTAVSGLNQYFENVISEKDGKGKVWL